jgi:hypothetical protein
MDNVKQMDRRGTVETPRTMTRIQWTNLYRSWRWALTRMTLCQASAWIAFYSVHDAALLLYVHNGCRQGAIVSPNLQMS